MKKIRSFELLQKLKADTHSIVALAELLQQEDANTLLCQPAPGKWSVIQILDHLNSYGHYYLPAIAKTMEKTKPAQEFFKPGWLGDYFTKLISPAAEGKPLRKMKAPNGHRPPLKLDAKKVMDEFFRQQQEMLLLLDAANYKNIGSLRTPISISRFIRLKLGDTFRFLIAHEQRHFVQILNALSMLRVKKDIFQEAPQAM